MNNESWPIELGSSGVLSTGPWLRARAVLWALLLCACGFACFLSTQYLPTWLHLRPDSSYHIVLGVPLVAFGAYALVVRYTEKREPVEVLPDASMIPELLMGALLGCVMLCATTALLWSLGLYDVQTNHLQHSFDSFVFDSYLSGMMEELLFRAILLRIIGRAFGLGWGLGLSAALFGAAHLGHASWMAATQIAINGGLTMGLAYMATGRIWMSIGLHVAWDFTEDSLLGIGNHNGLLLSTPVPGRSHLLTGGTFGPDASALAPLIAVLAIAAIVYGSRRNFFNRHFQRSRDGLVVMANGTNAGVLVDEVLRSASTVYDWPD